ncbi:hypothetical protein E5A73_07455 [Sphingomonas gei]|uniref:Uncharacterized protein n=1 Tax=Sphingomonas gei TaxID=1395960 RepID=A0A4S1XCY9_9SPHN|nr:hypothetical protein [Sphingomonas gei]TGX53961.1 hypothetical protein E5A73_07455 [Sphingomonas gei]
MGDPKSVSVPAVPADGPTVPVPAKPVWNSLEVAKILVSLVTPLAVLLVGYGLSSQASQVAAARERQERAREWRSQKQARDDAANREETLRLAGIQREDGLREAAEDRDDALRGDAVAREEAHIRDAEARDVAARRETLELARLSRILEKRIEIWDKVGPEIYGMLHRMAALQRKEEGSDAAGDAAERAAILDRLNKVDGTIDAYRSYFSGTFFRLYRGLQQDIRTALHTDQIKRGNSKCAYVGYDRLVELARRELALRTDPLMINFDKRDFPDCAWWQSTQG